MNKQVEVEVAKEQQQGTLIVEDDEQEAIWRFECQLRLKFDFNGTIIQWGLNCHANTITNCCKVCLWQAYGVVLWTTCMAWIEV